MSGKRAFLELLKQEGVEIVFGNPGTTELPLMDAFAVENDIKYVLGLQEAALMSMADGYAQASGKLAVIDYAHTPDALEKALQVLRAHCRGKLICVFGCGGDRDSGKRPQMGAVAQRWSDHIILTNDNPRSEDPQQIISDIQAGTVASADVRVEMDRAKAIECALELAQAPDIVLIAGKGHEDYQLIGFVKHHFSDREIVQAYMRRVV